jgi:hypothetical protein
VTFVDAWETSGREQKMESERENRREIEGPKTAEAASGDPGAASRSA